jgi:hypothetical protein
MLYERDRRMAEKRDAAMDITKPASGEDFVNR